MSCIISSTLYLDKILMYKNIKQKWTENVKEILLYHRHLKGCCQSTKAQFTSILIYDTQ